MNDFSKIRTSRLASRLTAVSAVALSVAILQLPSEMTLAEEDMSMTDNGMSMDAADGGYKPEFTMNGELKLPDDAIWRNWRYIGTPLTPNALNNGEAAFPEFHSVYVEPNTFDYWQRTGEFPDGAVLAKELTRILDVDAMADGSTLQVSGRGYFMSDFSGFEIMHKSAKQFPDQPGNWGFFSFGHHAPPYDASAKLLPVETCNACHAENATQDYVFTKFYPVLRAAKGAK